MRLRFGHKPGGAYPQLWLMLGRQPGWVPFSCWGWYIAFSPKWRWSKVWS